MWPVRCRAESSPSPPLQAARGPPLGSVTLLRSYSASECPRGCPSAKGGGGSLAVDTACRARLLHCDSAARAPTELRLWSRLRMGRRRALMWRWGTWTPSNAFCPTDQTSRAAKRATRECLLTQLAHLKCIRLGSVRSSHLPLKMH